MSGAGEHGAGGGGPTDAHGVHRGGGVSGAGEHGAGGGGPADAHGVHRGGGASGIGAGSDGPTDARAVHHDGDTGADDGERGGSDERLLALLRASPGEHVSGERIATALGVSRAAVSKRVAELRRRGFAIAATPRVGYRLDHAPDSLTAEAITGRITTRWLGAAWRYFRVCGSTNDEAAAWARVGAPIGAVVVADEQQRGRGRLGRRWHSPPGESLYFSVVLRPPLPPHRVPPVTLAAAVAVAEAIEAFGVVPTLKWPNDVQLDGKKVAGILTEMSCDPDRVHHLVVGIGVNLNTRELPPELEPIATSLARARGGAVERAAFAVELCARLERWYERFLDAGAPAIVAAWKRFAPFLGRRLRVRSGNELLDGLAENLDDEGALLLRDDTGRLHRVIAGEVNPPDLPASPV